MTRLILALLVLAAPMWGQLQLKIDILRATYGTGSMQADVTERVKSYLSNGGIQLRVGADTLGVDPAPNAVKTLAVEYRQGILRRLARVNDGEMLRLGTVPAETLRITKAMYGDGRRMRDVASVLAGRISGNRLEMAVTNENLGGDPAPAVKKSIVVDYEYNGQPSSVTVAEGQTLVLPPGAAAGPVSQLRVTRAVYSAGLRGRSDVTSAVASMVTANTLEFTVDGNVLGADPAPGTVKTLTVDYEWNGQRLTATAKDGEVLRVNKAAPAAAVGGALRVTRASYGAGLRGRADVTSAVASMVTANTLEFTVDGNVLGADPAPGTVKTLTVDYEWNGQRLTATAKDGEVLRVNKAAPAAAAGGALRILRASYSGGRRAAADVTRIVTERVSGDFLELTVSGDTLGGDPAPGTVKTLTVEYEWNGQRQTATARDLETLVIPAVTSLSVVRASYGVPGRMMDTTPAVASRLSNNRLELTVTGDTLGGDPAPGVVKTLTVDYDLNGRRRTATAQDGETLRVPGGGSRPAAPSGAIGIPLKGKAPLQQMGAAGPCLYRQPNYGGEAVCLTAGQATAAIANGQAGFRSLRMNGAAAIDLFELPNYTGRSQSINADVPDLLRLPGTWWRYEAAAPVQSARAR
jgi:hypothetical protein